MAQANVIAKVVLVVGQAYAKSANGSMRKLAVGDVIREGEQIVTSQGGRVELGFDDGSVRLARVNEPVHPESFMALPNESAQKPAELSGGDSGRVIDALAQGRNLDDLLEDPAAGLRTGGGRSDGGHDFVRLDRIVEPVTPLSFDFGTPDRTAELPLGGLATTTPIRNLAPDAIADTNSVTERVDSTVPSTTSGNVLTTAPHGTGFTDQADSDPENDVLTVTQAQFGANPAVAAGTPMTLAYGTLILNPDGTYTYSVDNANPTVNALNFGGVLTEVVTYTISDGNGGTATTTLTITIDGVNDSPTATVGAPIVGPEDSPGIAVPLRGTDPDSPLQAVTVTALPPASQGTLLKPDGTPVVAGEPIPVGPDGTAQLTFVPAPNFNGTVNVPFLVTDNQGAPSPGANQQIIVTPINDAPLANDDSASTPNGQPVTIGVLGNDSDPDGDRLSIVGTPTAPNGTVVVNPDGTLTYRPNPGFSGTDTFTYTVTDPSGATDTATVTVNVAPPPPPSLTVSIGDATPVAEGGSLVFTVTLSGGTSASPITIPLTYAGTADPVLDINGQPLSVTIPAGSTSATVTVPTLNDGIAEGPETVLVNLGTPNNPAVTVVDGQGTGTITDVGAPSLTVSIGDATPVAEGGSLVFTVTLSGGTSASPITIPLTYAGTADPVLDINGQPLSVTIPAGSTSATVTVPTLNDGIAEGPETVLVNLGTPNNPAVTVVDGQGTGTITDVGAPSLTVSIGDATPVAEGGSLVFTVTLSGGTSASPITIPLTYAGTADPVLDINGQPLSVTIPAGSTSATVTVPTLNDGIVEGPETVLVNLGTPSNPAVTVVDGQGTGTITDVGAPSLTVSIGDATPVAEGGSLVFTVTLSGGTSASPITIPLTYAGTADPVLDINGQPLSVTIPAGSTSATVNVPTLNDGIAEGPETVLVSLGTPNNPAVTVVDGQGTGTIIDNDGAPQLSITGPAEVNEAAGTLTYTVTLSNASASPVTVNYATSNGSATLGSDFTATPGTLTFAPGETSKTITVAITNDATYEGAENFNVVLSAPSNATIATGSVTTTIHDDGTGTVPPASPRTTTVRRWPVSAARRKSKARRWTSR